ncbi:MAG: hypothetical protein ACRDT4_10140 [Micromonosporaceae bacterium]
MTDTPPVPGGEPARRRKSRREKIHEEIARNRAGDYTVPTWVLFLALVAMVGGLVLIVVLSR